MLIINSEILKTKNREYFISVYLYWWSERGFSCNVAHCFGHSVACFSPRITCTCLLKSNLRPLSENCPPDSFLSSGPLHVVSVVRSLMANKKTPCKREFFLLVEIIGIEPTTYRLRTCRSPN